MGIVFGQNKSFLGPRAEILWAKILSPMLSLGIWSLEYLNKIVIYTPPLLPLHFDLLMFSNFK